MPGPVPNPVASDPDLPVRADVVVIGGGIVGCSTALELAERGLSVLLCEKGEIAAEQSSRNWGWVRLSMRDSREIALMIVALDLWQGLDARTGRDTGYRRAGIVFAATSDRQADRQARWAKNLAGTGIAARILDPAGIDRLLPGHRMATRGGIYTPLDGRAEPQWATAAIAGAARDAGAGLITGCAVRSLDIAAGRVAGVITERGRVACAAVVLAGGAWSRLFAGNAGIGLPQLKVLNSVLCTTPVSGGPVPAIWHDRFALRARADGGYTIASGGENTVDIVPDSFRLARAFLPALAAEWRSLRLRLSRRWCDEARQARRWTPAELTPFETCRILDPAPSQTALRAGWAAAQAAIPALAGASVAQGWGGMIDVTPDAIPVISAHDAVPGLTIATGFSGHGFGIGPAAGRLAADIVTNARPVVDPQAFRLSRFTDGSRIEPQPGL